MVSFAVPTSWLLVAIKLASNFAVLAAIVVLRVVVQYAILTALSSTDSSTVAVPIAVVALGSWS